MTDTYDWQALQRRLDATAERLARREDDRLLDPDGILKERARDLARPATTPATRAEVQELIAFACGHEAYALESRFVQRVFKLTTVFPVPGTPAWVLGITGFEGDVLPVFDLQIYWDVAGMGLRDRPWLIVLGDERAQFGFVAERLLERPRFDARHERGADGPSAAAGLAPIKNVNEQGIQLLDGRALLDDPGLYVGPTE